MSESASPPPASPRPDPPVRDAAAAAAWIEKLSGAVGAASAEARSAFFYYAGFGLYFSLTVAGTTHEQLLRGSTVTMPGLGIGLPIEGFYLFVPLLFVVFHIYALLQLLILARRIGLLKQALRSQRGSGARLDQDILLSPFAISQRLFGEPKGLVPQTLLRVSIWLTMVLLPLGVLIATQIRFLPYHSEAVTWAHRLYILVDLVLLMLLWPAIIDPASRSATQRLGAVATRSGRDRRSPVGRALAPLELGRRKSCSDVAVGCAALARGLPHRRRRPALRPRRTGAVHDLRGSDHPGRGRRAGSGRRRAGRGAGRLLVAVAGRPMAAHRPPPRPPRRLA